MVILIITYFRSSSYNTMNNCEMQFYLQYVLGKDNPAGKKASMGNIVHKALECLAAYKVCLQEGKDSFQDENLGTLHLSDCTPENLIRLSFDWHRENLHHDDWDNIKDLRSCRQWLDMALSFYDGLFDPRNRHVLKPEQNFDFEIKKPWAKYHYKLPDGNVLDGYLSLKGTIDLITEVKPGVIEIIDWKTGAYRTDFSTGKLKDFDSLHNDPQLRIYHYAAHTLFPAYKDILMTIYYIRCGGPFSLTLSEDDLPETERIIQKQFERVKRTVKPKLTPGPPWSNHPHPKIANFKCFKLCRFAQQSEHDPNKTTCQFMNEQIHKIGINQVTKKFGDLSKINQYGVGGGSGYNTTA